MSENLYSDSYKDLVINDDNYTFFSEGWNKTLCVGITAVEYEEFDAKILLQKDVEEIAACTYMGQHGSMEYLPYWKDILADSAVGLRKPGKDDWYYIIPKTLKAHPFTVGYAVKLKQ